MFYNGEQCHHYWRVWIYNVHTAEIGIQSFSLEHQVKPVFFKQKWHEWMIQVRRGKISKLRKRESGKWARNQVRRKLCSAIFGYDLGIHRFLCHEHIPLNIAFTPTIDVASWACTMLWMSATKLAGLRTVLDLNEWSGFFFLILNLK